MEFLKKNKPTTDVAENTTQDNTTHEVLPSEDNTTTESGGATEKSKKEKVRRKRKGDISQIADAKNVKEVERQYVSFDVLLAQVQQFMSAKAFRYPYCQCRASERTHAATQRGVHHDWTCACKLSAYFFP